MCVRHGDAYVDAIDANMDGDTRTGQLADLLSSSGCEINQRKQHHSVGTASGHR